MLGRPVAVTKDLYRGDLRALARLLKRVQNDRSLLPKAARNMVRAGIVKLILRLEEHLN